MKRKVKINHPPYVKVRQGKDGQWYWTRHAKNVKIVADGGEGYSTKSNCTRAAKKEANAHGIPVVYAS